MTDKIYEGFLRRQEEQGMALAADSDRLDLLPGPGEPPDAYIAKFHCKGFVRPALSAVTIAEHFLVAIKFPADYLRRAEPFDVLRWVSPREVFHPNISDKAPFICIGRLAPGTSLVDILYQCFEIITYNKVTMREDDALNHEACAWARSNQHRFPIDTRPLKRGHREFFIEGTGISAEGVDAPLEGAGIDEVK